MTQFGMTQKFWPRDEPILCRDPEGLCGHAIALGHPYWVDADGIIYCDDCGKAERFARKRAALREASGVDPSAQDHGN
jgi:hypothetical protein